MKRSRITLLFLLLVFVLFQTACHQTTNPGNDLIRSEYVIESDAHYIDGFPALYKNGDINAIIEIPAGSIEKWEVDKTDGKLKWEFVDGHPRNIRYLGYPANYGMVPRTLLPESKGGDGDPLDVLVLGPPYERGSVVRCRIIGVLYLVDRGEQDDKLIAVSLDSAFSDIDSMDELEKEFAGLKEILSIWFANYKGPGKLSSKGFGEKEEALAILADAIEAFE
ncbi:MAG: inorganic diphosphatase [Bacteroidales bacterium]|nr:inorganic diphosphatase [Bacteroidales bacterium]